MIETHERGMHMSEEDDYRDMDKENELNARLAKMSHREQIEEMFRVLVEEGELIKHGDRYYRPKYAPN